MARHWQAACRGCGKSIGYSDNLWRQDRQLGRARPTLCAACETYLRRELRAVAMPGAPAPNDAIAASPLGGFRGQPTPHQRREKHSLLDPKRFGVTEGELHNLYRQLSDPNVPIVIAVAPTGSGKSTYLPYRLLQPFPLDWFPPDFFTRRGQIVITQPRIAPTQEISRYVSEDLFGMDRGCGFDIGLKHSGNPACNWRNRMVYVTDGTLINWLAAGDVEKIGLIMIDEAHERSLNIDVILGSIVRLLPRHPHLKVVIASATIDKARFQKFFTGGLPGDLRCEIVDMSGQSYGTTAHFRPAELPGVPYEREIPRELNASIASFVAEEVVWLLQRMNKQTTPQRPQPVDVPPGDIVAFLHGRQPIDDAVKAIQDLLSAWPHLAAKTDVLPLYRELSDRDKQRAIGKKNDPTRRRVVVSSNLAETSLTIEGIVHVVDSGVIKVNRWDPETERTRLTPMTHSQGGCRQRWGRAGRLGPGHAWCLYTESQFTDESLFPKETPAEISRSPLDQVVVAARRGGASRLTDGGFPWLDEPPPGELEGAERRLQREGLLDADGDLTSAALLMREEGEDAESRYLLSTADRFGLGMEMATILPLVRAGLQALLPWDRDLPPEIGAEVVRRQDALRANCHDDLDLLFKLYHHWHFAQQGCAAIACTPAWQEAWQKASRALQAALPSPVDARRGGVGARLARIAHRDELHGLAADVGLDLAGRTKWIERAEGAFSTVASHAWCCLHGVNEGALRQAASERGKLIDQLGVKKKEKERRDLHFGALDRLRCIFAYCVPDKTLIRDETSESVRYRPLVEVESRTPVEYQIDRVSLLAGRDVECFVSCGPKSIGAARGDAPQVRYFPFVVALPPDLPLQVRDHTPLQLAAFMAARFPPPSAQGAGDATAARLLLDYFHPVGTRVRARVVACQSNRYEVEVVENLGYPASAKSFDLPPVGNSRNREQRENLRDRVEQGLVKQGDHLAVNADEQERETRPDLLEDAEAAELPETSGGTTATRTPEGRAATPHRAPGVLDWFGDPLPVVGAAIEAQIQAVIAASDDGGPPRVHLEWPDRETRFKNFVERFRMGDALCVIALPDRSTEECLVLREVQSSLEVTLPVDEAGVPHGQIAALAWSRSGMPPVTVTHIDAKTQRVTVSLWPVWEPWLATLDQQAEPAKTRLTVLKHDAHLWAVAELPFGQRKCQLPMRIDVDDLFDDQPGHRYSPGAVIEARLRVKGRAFFSPRVARDIVANAAAVLKENGIEYINEELVAQGRLSWRQRQTLLKRLDDPDLRYAVTQLHGYSNQVLGMSRDPRLAAAWKVEATRRLAVGQIVSVKVASVRSHGLVVELAPNLRCFMHQSQYPRDVTPFEQGQSVQVRIESVDPLNERLQVTMRDPWIRVPARYPVGGVVEATVVSVGEDHANLQLEPGVTGRAFIREIARHWVDDVRNELQVGERRRVKILRLQAPSAGARGKIDLSIKQALGAALTSRAPSKASPTRPATSARNSTPRATPSHPRRHQADARRSPALRWRCWLAFPPAVLAALFISDVWRWLSATAPATLESLGVKGENLATVGFIVSAFFAVLIALVALASVRFFRAPLMLSALGIAALLFPFHQTCLWLRFREQVGPALEAATLGRAAIPLGWLSHGAQTTSSDPWFMVPVGAAIGLFVLGIVRVTSSKQ